MLLSCLPFTVLQIFKSLSRHLFPPFKSNPFQLNSDRTALFVILKRWKSLSIDQIIKLATAIIVTKRYSHGNSNISDSGPYISVFWPNAGKYGDIRAIY